MNAPRIATPRHVAAILAVAVLLIAVALPVLAASPSPSVAPAASALAPGAQETNEPKESEAPEVSVTIPGLVKSAPDADGRPEFTLEASGKTLKLHAGPKWFHGTADPLLPFVGKTVTVVGEQSGDEVDVESVDGTVIRAPGKPPWAGGWKVVGKDHPGWSQEKADRHAAKQRARDAARAACVAAGQTPDQCQGNGHDQDDGDESPEPAETPGIG